MSVLNEVLAAVRSALGSALRTAPTLWQDRERRRALLLSLVVHAFSLLALLWVWTRPQALELDNYLVLDVGTPDLTETVTDAPAADDPAPQAAEPQIADTDSGEPQAAAPPEPSPAEPEPAPIPAPEVTAEVEPQPELEPRSEPQPVPVPEVTAEAAPEPLPEPSPVSVPAPAAQAPDSPPADLPLTNVTATALPEIEEPLVEPQPLAQAIPVPRPAPAAEVTPARSVAATASVQVAPAEAVPRPQVSASVAEPQAVPQPQVSASVAQAVAAPQPEVSASVAPPVNVQPQVSASVAAPREVPQPTVAAAVAPGRSVAVTPQARVSAAQAVPRPQVSAAVTVPDTAAGVAGAGDAASPEGAPNLPPSAITRPGPPVTRPPGGNAATSGQTADSPDASADGLGAAASPEGSAAPTGATFTLPYRENRERPLAVILDNVRGYPQHGLREASLIAEMPVEGGLTRLMSVYDQNDPAQVGPVRSARDYFHEFAQSMDGVLVHDGGSPAALAAIARSELPSINAYTSGELFGRSAERGAPYNLYTQGTSLRETLSRLRLERSRTLSGTVYRPEADAETSAGVSVQYSDGYASAFTFLNDLNRYRWIRSGEEASDAAGEAVYVDAVIVASVEARPIPDDPEGRLYMPLRGGTATLYLRGKAVPGRWDPEGGLRFTSSFGEIIELTPFKTWVLFAPQSAQIVVQ